MERSRRFAYFIFALAAAILLFAKGHGLPDKGGPVAFLHQRPDKIRVMVRGEVDFPGVYGFFDTPDVGSVMKMAVPSRGIISHDHRLMERKLADGALLDVAVVKGQSLVITTKKMGARERVTLGILLDINSMDAADWEYLPGVGPELAKRIVENRQKYGDYRSLEELQRIPGIGDRKVRMLRRYFE